MNRESNPHEKLNEYFCQTVDILDKRPVSGGDINKAYVLTLSNGTRVFMKENRKENIDFFRAEKEGLEAIEQTGTIRVPHVISDGTEENASFLLMEYIEEGRKSRTSSEDLGRKLAEMHRADTSAFVRNGKYGFLHDNYIGAGYQSNKAEETWIEFFIKRRLRPQFERADRFWEREDRKKNERFLVRAEDLLVDPEKPSLLHGDLWAGNYMIDSQGKPCLIDPAAYVGHAEADLAMTELFGGFDRTFYSAYQETAGIDPGYRDRRDIYNLYHLLNHLNMFGGSYLHSVKAIINQYI